MDDTAAPAERRMRLRYAGTCRICSTARREFERRKATREQRIRTKHPKLGGLILALSDEPQSTTSWDTGAVGEERLGSRLDASESETCRVLHDRRMPGSRANIDHLAVTLTDVYVIDAKRSGCTFCPMGLASRRPACRALGLVRA